MSEGDDPQQQCIFCHIIAGAVAAKRVYEDEKVVGVLDINPANPGHVLLLPREHYAFMPQLPEDLVQHMGMVAKQLSFALIRALKVTGTNIFVANGESAGQRALHVMLHIIPRLEGDGVVGLDIPLKQQSSDELAAIKKKLSVPIKEALGFEPVINASVPESVQSNLPVSKSSALPIPNAPSPPSSVPSSLPFPLPDAQKLSSSEKSESPNPNKVSLSDIADFLSGGKQ